MNILQEPYEFKAHESHIIDLTFTPDGTQLLTAGMDNIVHCYSVKDGSLLLEFVGHEKSVNSLNVTRDGKHLITASSDRTVRLWDLETGKEIELLKVKGSAAQLSAQNTYLGIVDQAWLTIMAVHPREILKRFKPFAKRTTALSFSPQDDLLAVGGQGDDILLFSLPDLEQVHSISDAHQDFVLSLAFAPDELYLASTGYEGRSRLWSTHNWEVLGEVLLENRGVQALTFSPQGEILAVASDHRVTMIAMPSLSIIQKIDLKPKGVYCLAFSSDGRYFACGAADKRVRLWNLLD